MAISSGSKVKFVSISKSSYDALATKDASTVYFVKDTDNNRIYLDGVPYIGDKDVLFATADDTTYEELVAAINADKIIFLKGSANNEYEYRNPLAADWDENQRIVCLYESPFFTQDGQTAWSMSQYSFTVDSNSTWTEVFDEGSIQSKLVSGSNIKTINNQSILGSGNLDIQPDLSNYYTESETDTLLAGKQDTLVSGTTLKTINSTSLLGSGNIEILTGEYDTTNTKVELEQGTSAISFIQTTDGLSVVAATGSTPTEFIDRELVSKSYVSRYQTQAQVEALIADELSRFDKLDYQIVTTLPATGAAGVRYMIKHPTDDRYEEWIYVNNQWYDIGATDEVNLTDYYTKQEADLLLADKADSADIPTLTSELTNDGDGTHSFVTFGNAATGSTYGLIKLNPAKSIGLNAEGQLEVGGMLGQFPNGGVYYPDTIEPTNVGGSTFMITDGAKNLGLAGRTFGIMAGANVTCKSTAAGSTVYRVSNSQGNRFALFAVKGGRAAIDQTDAMTNGTAAITSIKFANGNDISAYFGPTESSNDIIVTLEKTINPTAATTKMRVYGTSTSSDVIVVGQGCGATGGKAISLGQSCFAGGNQCIAFGNSSLSLGNNSVALGHTHLVNKQFCFCAGQGHDFTNASNGASAVGIASLLDSNTAFAVGNGVFNANGSITRSNAFEVTSDGGIVLKSPNGTRYKVTVSDSGSLSVAAV